MIFTDCDYKTTEMYKIQGYVYKVLICKSFWVELMKVVINAPILL